LARHWLDLLVYHSLPDALQTPRTIKTANNLPRVATEAMTTPTVLVLNEENRLAPIDMPRGLRLRRQTGF